MAVALLSLYTSSAGVYSLCRRSWFMALVLPSLLWQTSTQGSEEQIGLEHVRERNVETAFDVIGGEFHRFAHIDYRKRTSSTLTSP